MIKWRSTADVSATDNRDVLARDAFVRTNRRAIAMMFVYLSVCLGRACIVIVRCILAQI